MQTKQIIQASANVIRITKLSKGNIYKRFDDYDYTYYGVVTDVLNDGTNTIITSIEYKKSYSDISVSQKVIKGEKDFIIFPATIDELQMEFQDVIDSKNKEIETKYKEIEISKKLIEHTEKLLNGELQKELTTPEFKELTQVDYNERLEALN